jgi:hypothetical protein
MKQTVLSLFILVILIGCSPHQEKIDRTIDEGVEVVLNRLEPYTIKGTPSRLVLEKESSIDTEDEAVVKVGLTEMETFDVDAEGNIYIIRWQSNENYVFKFDKTGSFVASFLRRGQGPGELEWGGTVFLDHDGNVFTKDPSLPRYAIYDRDGRFIKEVKLKENTEIIAPLSNGRYFCWRQIQEPEMLRNFLGVSDSTVESWQEVYRKDTPNQLKSSEAKVKVGGRSVIWQAGRNRLYVGDADKGYEVRVYDLGGTLLRKIRKVYKPVSVSDEFKQEIRSRIPGDYRSRLEFAAAWPPFLSFIEDEEGRLLVGTFEKGVEPGEKMFDIFSREGVFIGRVSIANRNAQQEQYALPCLFKGGRLYALHDKESGFRELSVYRMRWE